MPRTLLLLMCGSILSFVIAASPRLPNIDARSRQIKLSSGISSGDPVVPVPERIDVPVHRTRGSARTERELIVVDTPAFAVPLARESVSAISLRPGDVLPIIKQVAAAQEYGSAHFYVTLHPEVGLATVSKRFAAERLTEVPADRFELPYMRADINTIIFAARPRNAAALNPQAFDEELLAIPAGSAHRSNTTLHTGDTVTIDLSTEFAGGGGRATFSPISLRVEDITGDGFAELAVDSRSHTVAGSRPYENETIETFWLTPNNGDPSELLHLVHETRFNSSIIGYTHSVVREDAGRIREIRSYATRRFGAAAAGVDKSVQKYDAGEFEWAPGRTRMSGIAAKRNPAGLRSEPDDAIRETDWLPGYEVVRPVDVHVDDEQVVWLKVDVKNGAAGWIEESRINWHPRR